MKEIYVLADYLNRFETKVPSTPYRSGFDKDILNKEFEILGYKCVFLNYSEIDFKEIDFKNKYVIYTSIEDSGLYYKDFIEDILWGIKIQGGILLPSLEMQRAHHNKVFMEILRAINGIDNNIHSRYFGSIKELIKNSGSFQYPIVLKSASGSGSKGVKLVNTEKELQKKAKIISKVNLPLPHIKEYLLLFKRYLQTKRLFKIESIYRRKFITQNFIPQLDHDFKILIYGDKYYILKRNTKKNDFRASGSGIFEFVNNQDIIPVELLNYSKLIYNKINAPNLSIDVAYNDEGFYLIEFQAVSFGTVTQTGSLSYYLFEGDSWIKKEEVLLLEKVYAQSINLYIKKNYGS